MIQIREKKYIDNREVSRIMVSAFGSKITKAFKFDIEVLEEMIYYTLNERNRGKTLVAIENSTLLGYIKLQSKQFDMKGVKIKLSNMVKKFGLLNTIKFKIANTSLDYLSIKKNELYVSQLAVADNARGKGVGTLLLEAGEKECNKLLNSYTLYVMKENDGAYNLYNKRGFVSKKVIKPPFFQALTGYTAAIYMVKSIA